MAGKRFLRKSPVDCADTLWVKNFIEIALSRTVSEINAFFHFTQSEFYYVKSLVMTLLHRY